MNLCDLIEFYCDNKVVHDKSLVQHNHIKHIKVHNYIMKKKKET